MSARCTALFLLAISATAACTDPSGPRTPPPANALDTVLQEARARYHLPGMAAMVLHGAGPALISATGVRKLGGHDPLQPGDRFHLGSNMKAMTATMLATLVEEGTLQWNSRPLDLFPELAGQVDPAHEAITLAQLLQHRAGIEPLVDFSQVPALSGTPMEQRAEGTALLLSLPPAAPVDSFLYSNGGYGIAAAMAERATGMPWETLMQERVFAPLGMTVEFGWPAATDPAQPWGHEETSDGYRTYSPNRSPDPRRMPTAIAPAGEGSMTLADYARFVQLHLRGLRGQAGLVDSATFARLHAPVGVYAMGWGELSLDGVATATHEGSTGTFYATTFIQPARDLAVVVVTNAGGHRAGQAVTEAALALLARYGRGE